jgi:L-asparaginase
VIHVLSAGGTIAMDTIGAAGLAVPVLAGEQLIAAVPGLDDVADIGVSSFRLVPGAHLTLADLRALADEVDRRLTAGADGIVVTQGTDTIEETAFALDLLLDHERPVVMTGAMRNPGQAGADGPANLLSAIRVARSPAAARLGVLVVMNDEIHAARLVRKEDAVGAAAFHSPDAGPLGRVVEGEARILLRPRPLSVPTVRTGSRGEQDVALLSIGLGESGRLFGAVAERGYRAAVVEALGAGHVPPPAADALKQLANEIPVVLASRTGSGHLPRRTYGFAGSETDLLDHGLIPAPCGLDARKTRILLALLLGSSQSTDEIRMTIARIDRGVDGG